MTQIYLGEPPAKVKQWIIDHYTPPVVTTPYVYAGTNGSDHEHKFFVTELTGDMDWENEEQIGTQTCISGETINNADIIYLSSDLGCTCTSIRDNAFYECSNLSSINCQNVTSIGSRTFYKCSSLFSINCPNVTSIGYEAFRGCSNLSSIDLPNVTSIGLEAFGYCSNLSSIDLPNVTSIDGMAFSYCRNLSSIDFGATMTSVPTVESDSFDNCPTISCYIPDALYDTWTSATNWSTYIEEGKIVLIKQSER